MPEVNEYATITGDELSESFFLIPSENTMIALKKENNALKAEVQSIKKKLETTERVLQLRKEQDMQLRDSIVQASKEVNQLSIVQACVN
jgi:uncharacterized protein YcgL (UPF0745 family)